MSTCQYVQITLVGRSFAIWSTFNDSIMSTTDPIEEKKDADCKEQEQEATADTNQEHVENEVEATETENKKPTIEEEMSLLRDKYVRLHAEFDNFRKRNAKERVDLINTASRDVILDLLPVIDDFDRAIHANETNDDIKAVKEGLNLIQQKMFRTLEGKGIKAMDSVGKKFDTDHHEAITQIPAPSKKLRGKVVDVVEKGYFLNDTVLRYAKVVVGQ